MRVSAASLLPALLGFVGRRIDRLVLPHRHRHADESAGGSRTPAFRWSRVVQRRPLPYALGSLALLLLLAAPVLDMRLGFGDASTQSADDTRRQPYDLIAEGFGPGANGPLVIAADLAETDGAMGMSGLERVADDLSRDAGVAEVGPVVSNEQGTAALVSVEPATGPQDKATGELVQRLRDRLAGDLDGTGVEAYVGGSTAAVIDFADFTASRLPLFVGVVLALSFVLLMVVFRSVLVPLKAVVVNLLSIGAAFGAVVALFQWSWAVDLLDLNAAAPVEAWVPMMLVAIVFGLSMDYKVFLISRIKEEYDRTRDNGLAVADGLARTARVITAAAAIMIAVFTSIVLGSARDLKMFGFGLAFAVLVDATLVRMVLAPAAMELLGDRNWWLPRRLAAVLPRVRTEGPLEPGASQPEPVTGRFSAGRR